MNVIGNHTAVSLSWISIWNLSVDMIICLTATHSRKVEVVSGVAIKLANLAARWSLVMELHVRYCSVSSVFYWKKFSFSVNNLSTREKKVKISSPLIKKSTVEWDCNFYLIWILKVFLTQTSNLGLNFWANMESEPTKICNLLMCLSFILNNSRIYEHVCACVFSNCIYTVYSSPYFSCTYYLKKTKKKPKKPKQKTFFQIISISNPSKGFWEDRLGEIFGNQKFTT